MASSSKPALVDIGAWLDGLGLSIYREAFAANHIDADTLPLLTAADLQEIGVTSVGHRRWLIEAIGALAPHPQAAEGKETPQAAPEPAVLAPSRGRAPAVERRQITVMFCDLVGSHACARERARDRGLAGLRRPARAAAARLARSFAGDRAVAGRRAEDEGRRHPRPTVRPHRASRKRTA